ncbi:MAG TPA: glycosyltransferase family 39 protein [Candidatus Dormibacteraeota bacterium]|nr:glycosyltransferase family 39 protein [Candidatus Dormibacteraeota bacterium]
MTPKTRFWVGLLVLAAGAAAIRIIGLRDLPPGLFCDEAGLGYNAWSLLHTGRDETGTSWPLYVWSFGVSYKNPIFIYSAMLPVGLFGLSEFSVRLTSALFGVATVIGIGLLGRIAFGAAGGLIAALLLAVVPWHVHFSRIAFELITFPALFVFAFAALAAGVRGRPRWLLLAGPLFALCLYTYGPAKLFVPGFLVGALLIYARRLWAARRTLPMAIVLMVLTAMPVLVFDLSHRDRSGQYFSRTTALNASQSVEENARRVVDQYERFFSRAFLFDNGDPLTRHAVPGFGELYWTMLPLLALGVLWCLWPGRPEGKLFLWWMVLYPVAPALMNEAPSASRGFIGVAGFCLVAAAGATLVLDGLRRIIPWVVVARVAQSAAVLALIAGLAYEGRRYWTAYTTTYPVQAADDFQYGYREAINFMEDRRSQYDLLLLTANHVNMPQIFAAFYTAERPGGIPSVREHGYLILDPAEYNRYEMNQRILAALREDDVRLFDDYTELHRVLQPSGKTEYVIAEVRGRKRFLRDWLLLGPFDNRGDAGVNRNYITPADVQPRAIEGVWGPVYWRRVLPQFVRVDLNAGFRHAADVAGKPLEWMCGYATTQVQVPTARHAVLEIGAANQPVQAWVNGNPITERMVPVPAAPQRWPIQLHEGANQVLLKICKANGDWFFTARVTDNEGRDLSDATIVAAMPEPAAAGSPQVPTQQVDGFAAPVRASRFSELYSDYRGNARAWWEALEDGGGEVVWTTDPAPARAPTVFDFTAAMSEQPGTAELWVNGHYALSFPTGRFATPQRWARGPYVLEFLPKEQGNDLSGAWRLLVPAEDITAGQPVELRVAHRDGSPFAFFQIKGRDDTAQAEQLTLDGAAALAGQGAAVAPPAPVAAPGA